MLTLLLILIWAAIALVAIALQKTYHQLPIKELKRRVRSGDEFAQLLLRAVNHGAALDVLLWLFVGVSSAILFVVLVINLPVWAAILAVAFIMWLGFLWLPEARFVRVGGWIARGLTPALDWLLVRSGTFLRRISEFINHYRPVHVHTGLYQKEDLLELLERQQVQSDSRITEQELQLAYHALTFGEKTVRDCLTPRRVVKSVSADDHIGPIFLSELHDSGHSRFPVYEPGDKEKIVGVLYLRDLVDVRKGGKVRSHMSSEVLYIHEDAPLAQALHAFLKTQRHLFLVVNGFEEIVGIITIEDVIEAIIGGKIVDEFDKYDDMRAVAAQHANRDHETYRAHHAEQAAPLEEQKEAKN